MTAGNNQYHEKGFYIYTETSCHSSQTCPKLQSTLAFARNGRDCHENPHQPLRLSVAPDATGPMK